MLLDALIKIPTISERKSPVLIFFTSKIQVITNPYQPPVALGVPPTLGQEQLPAIAVKKATNLVRDSRLILVTLFIPIVGLVFIFRLVQWYQLRRQYPMLETELWGEHGTLAQRFRSAKIRLWLGALLWPILMVVIFALSWVSHV